MPPKTTSENASDINRLVVDQAVILNKVSYIESEVKDIKTKLISLLENIKTHQSKIENYYSKINSLCEIMNVDKRLSLQSIENINFLCDNSDYTKYMKQ